MVVKRSDMVTVDGSIKGRGRTKLTLEMVVRKNQGLFVIMKYDAIDSSKKNSRSQPQLMETQGSGFFFLVYFFKEHSCR